MKVRMVSRWACQSLHWSDGTACVARTIIVLEHNRECPGKCVGAEDGQLDKPQEQKTKVLRTDLHGRNIELAMRQEDNDQVRQARAHVQECPICIDRMERLAGVLRQGGLLPSR